MAHSCCSNYILNPRHRLPVPDSFTPSPPRHPKAESGYDPRRSRVSEDTLNDFLRGKISGDLQEVPGIGPAAAKRLCEGDEDNQVTNTFQLIGKVSVFVPFQFRCYDCALH